MSTRARRITPLLIALMIAAFAGFGSPIGSFTGIAQIIFFVLLVLIMVDFFFLRT